MPPTIPEDLSALSDEELSALEDELVQAFRDAAPDATTVEAAAELEAIAAGVDQVRGEITARDEAAQEIASRVTDLASRILVEDDEDADDTGDTDTGDDQADDDADAGDGTAQPGTPANPTTPAPNPETGEAPAPTARAASGRSLAAMGARVPAKAKPRPASPVGGVTITAAANNPNVPAGQRLNSVSEIAQLMWERQRELGPSHGPEDRVPVVRFNLDIPEERMFRREATAAENTRRLEAFTQVPALVAAGGLCAPVAGYYDQFVIAEAHRPVRDALPTFGAERGGIRFNPPPRLSQITQGVGVVTVGQDASGVTVADGATTSGSTTVTSATAAFTAADVGRTITGAGIPAGAVITAVTNATTVVISMPATATAGSVSITIGRGSKATFVVTCPAATEVDVQAIYTSAQFGNFVQRTFPEQVEAWTQLLLALSARTAETALLDGIATNSTAVTSAGLVGGARDVLARLGQAAAGYRSRNRMAPDARLTCLAPQWLFDMAQADLARTFAADVDIMAATRALYEGYLGARGVDVNWYSDSKTGGNQIIGTQAGGVLNQFPALAYIYLFAEGSFIRLDGGTLDLGLVRDSVLNANNNFRMFSELFENVAYVGVESLEIALTSYPDGTYGAAKTVTVPIVT